MGALFEGPHIARAERITLAAIDGVEVEAIHAAADAPRAGIVVHPDIMGVRPLFDDLSRRLASHGFAVCAPEPFARASGDLDEPAKRMTVLPDFEDDLQMDDLARAGALLRARHDVADVSVIGFCMGGMQVLKAAATGEFSRAVPFYGMIRVPDAWRGARLREPLATAKNVCPTLAIFGGVDRWTPDEDIDALRRAWKTRPDCEVVVYPEADHGFVHDPDRPVHRADDADDAWRRVLRFLGT